LSYNLVGAISIVSIVIRLWAAFTRNYDLIPVRAEYFTLFQSVHTFSLPTQHLVHWVMRNLSLG